MSLEKQLGGQEAAFQYLKAFPIPKGCHKERDFSRFMWLHRSEAGDESGIKADWAVQKSAAVQQFEVSPKRMSSPSLEVIKYQQNDHLLGY